MNLVLNSYGCSLRKKGGRFQVLQKKKETLLSPHKISSITVCSAATISTDALLLAVKHEIPVIILHGSGKPVGMFWSSRYGSISTIRRKQLAFAGTSEALHWIIDVLKRKSLLQIRLLDYLHDQRPRMRDAIQKTSSYIHHQMKRLDTLRDSKFKEAIPSLRGLEGNISRRYFQQISSCLPKKYQFPVRSRRPARDRFNAVLNYLYGMLYHTVETALVQAGLDPYLPFLHRDEYRKPGFVYDFIELFRPWADRIAVDLCLKKQLKQSSFQIKSGGLWLSDVGRKFVIEAFEKFIGERETFENERRERRGYLQLSAQAFAQQLIKG